MIVNPAKFRPLYVAVLIVFGAELFVSPTILHAQQNNDRISKISDSIISNFNARTNRLGLNPDLLWKKTVLREIDTRQKSNAVFINDSNSFFNLLNTAIVNGKIIAFKPLDDTLAVPITKEEFDTLGFTKYKNDVQKFRIKEVWFFDKKQGLMVVRIMALEPVLSIGLIDTPLYRVYYPDCVDFLSHNNVPHTTKDSITWYDYFESRQFSSKIIKVGSKPPNLELGENDTWVY